MLKAFYAYLYDSLPGNVVTLRYSISLTTKLLTYSCIKVTDACPTMHIMMVLSTGCTLLKWVIIIDPTQLLSVGSYSHSAVSALACNCKAC